MPHTKRYAEQKYFALSHAKADRSVMRATVAKAHIGTHTGSATNKAVRLHVNHYTTKIPHRIRYQLSYDRPDGVHKDRFIVVQNPRPKKGNWDAGHRLGQQLGGSGTFVDNIFPQNPTVNRYPHRGLPFTRQYNTKTPHSWRMFEDKIARKIQKYDHVDVKQKLYYKN